jgi:hypothetical protein
MLLNGGFPAEKMQMKGLKKKIEAMHDKTAMFLI